jgi:Protein of unknown function (DUF1186)
MERIDFLMTKVQSPLTPIADNDLLPTDEILHRIGRFTGTFERAAVKSAIRRQEEVTPELLRVLENVVRNAEKIDPERNYMAHLYAMFLLAQFREPRAYPLLVQLASLDGDLLYSLCGDFITEHLGRVLASASGGDLAGMQSIVEDEHADEWVRGSGLDGLLTMVVEGQMTRDSMVYYLFRLFRTLERRPSRVWNSMVSTSCDIYPSELLDHIRWAYRKGLVEPSCIRMDDVKDNLALGKGRVLARLAADPHFRMVQDTVKEMGCWFGFRQTRNEVRAANLRFVAMK